MGNPSITSLDRATFIFRIRATRALSVNLCLPVAAQTIPYQGHIGTGAATYPPIQGTECLRPLARGVVTNPFDIYSINGVLSVALDYYTSPDSKGRILYYFVTPDGHIAPTLHVKPGDIFKQAVTNRVPVSMLMQTVKTSCGESVMYDSSLNVHVHGALVSPKCTKENVGHKVINSSDTFRYNVAIPNDEPPGLYWYHPLLHGIADNALMGV